MNPLTQKELDGLLSSHYSQMIAVQRHHQRLDDRADRLAYLQEHYKDGEPINVLISNSTGHVLFRHHSRGVSSFLEKLLALCAELLLDERRAIYASDWPQLSVDTSVPLPTTLVLDCAPPAPPSATAAPADPRLKAEEWLSRQEVADRAGITLSAVNLYMNKNRFISRPTGVGKHREYIPPTDFEWPVR